MDRHKVARFDQIATGDQGFIRSGFPLGTDRAVSGSHTEWFGFPLPVNILLITADQWRGPCLSMLGHPVVKTPNLDALAQDGSIFVHHFAQAAPCAPSRTSLHTGMYLFNHRCVTNGTPVSGGLTNWALETRKLGYDPSLFGYTDTAKDPMGLDPSDSRLSHYSEPLPGIGTYTPVREDVPVPWVEYLKQRGYPIPRKRWDLYGQRVPGTTWADGGKQVLPLAIHRDDHETAYMVRRCLEWIDVVEGDWVTHLSLLRPHPPFVAPEPYNERYPPDAIWSPVRHETRSREAAMHPFIAAMVQHPQFGSDADTRSLEDACASYYGLMTEVDEHLGRLFRFLKARDLWDDTLIIFTSDHGEQLGDHWLNGKLGFFDQSYHIPLIIRDPRRAADASRGKRFDVFTENVDIMPTMLAWLGMEIPSQCDGRSLLPILESASVPASWRTAVHWEYDFRYVANGLMDDHPGVSVHQCQLGVLRDKRFKYVHFPALPPLLYDLQNDPGELHDVSHDPDYQQTRLEYAERLLSLRMRYTARGLSETLLTPQGPVTTPARP